MKKLFFVAVAIVAMCSATTAFTSCKKNNPDVVNEQVLPGDSLNTAEEANDSLNADGAEATTDDAANADAEKDATASEAAPEKK